MSAALTPRQNQALLAAILGGLALLFAVAGFAIRWEHHERDTRAALHFSRARTLDQKRQLPEALLEYRTAVLIDRDRAEYQRALAETLVRAGRPREAETYLRTLLDRNPADGAANLLLARIRARRVLEEGAPPEEADTAYRRAISGDWHQAGAENAARLEWTRFLGEAGRASLQTAQLLIFAQETARPELRRLAAEAAAAPAGSAQRQAILDRLSATPPR